MNEVPKQDRFESQAVSLPAGHPTVALGKVGILLLNLGTPDGTSYWPMRRYLKEFLSDEQPVQSVAERGHLAPARQRRHWVQGV